MRKDLESCLKILVHLNRHIPGKQGFPPMVSALTFRGIPAPVSGTVGNNEYGLKSAA